MISIQNVHKRFGSQVVLSGIDLEIDADKTTTIVGPSGVGKSVLLKLVMGILQPDEGQILVCNKNITEAQSETEKNNIRRHIGVLFQSAALFDSLSVYDNVSFPLLERTRLNREEIHEKVCEMLRSLSLLKYAKRFPQEVSIGIRKRVGMARAIIMEPDVVLFDEPNTGLDPKVGQEVYDLILHCQSTWGFTGIVISHELPEVFQVSDRVVMLLGGEVVMDGTPDEFKASTKPEVQQFLMGKVDGPIRIH